MALFGFGQPSAGLQRLDSAVASHQAAQASVRRAGADVVETATAARRHAILARWQARRTSRELRDTNMGTGDVRLLVDDMLRDWRAH